MARMKMVRRPEDCSGVASEIDELFNALLPAGAEQVLRGAQQGWGLLAAHSPAMAMAALNLTRKIAAGPFLTARPDLREIAVQAVNMHFGCEFSYRSHLIYLPKVGLSFNVIAALPYWRTSSLFSDEQRLVVEYSLAVVKSEVTDALHADVVALFGQKSTAELAIAASFWSFWAMLLNAAQAKIDDDPTVTQ
jgi:alkylhydroperoxidase family enzyme